MSCAKCGGLEAHVLYTDYFEAHTAAKCLNCDKVRWVKAIPYSPPEKLDYLCDIAR